MSHGREYQWSEGHLLVFVSSWIIFLLGGRSFFDYGLGRYHSTHSKLLAFTSKGLFLLTFMTSATLLELVTFEILDICHPNIREIAWTYSLGIISLLLNTLIPAALIFSICIHSGMKTMSCIIAACLSVLIFNVTLWLVGGFLLPDVDLDDGYFTGIERDPLSLVNALEGDGSTNAVISGRSSVSLGAFLWNTIVVDVRTSVAHIAALGCATAAWIAGFATFSGPLEMWIRLRLKVDVALLKEKEKTLLTALSNVSYNKKKLLLLAKVDNNCQCNNVIGNNEPLYDHGSTSSIPLASASSMTAAVTSSMQSTLPPSTLSTPPPSSPSAWEPASNPSSHAHWNANIPISSRATSFVTLEGKSNDLMCATASTLSQHIHGGSVSDCMERNEEGCTDWQLQLANLRNRGSYNRLCGGTCHGAEGDDDPISISSNNISNHWLICNFHVLRRNITRCFLDFFSTVPFLKMGSRTIWRWSSSFSNFTTSTTTSLSGRQHQHNPSFHDFSSPYDDVCVIRRRRYIVETDIATQHAAAQEHFSELITLRDLYEQAASFDTLWGKVLRLSTWLFTIVGTVRLINCLFHVANYVSWMGRPLLNTQQIQELQKHGGYGRFGAVQDTNTMIVPMLIQSLYLDEKAWSPAISFLLVLILGLLQVRAFFIVTSQLAKFGIISTSTEIYSLLLAHISGAYFVACVVLLRAQLPPELRKGITKALGEHLHFGYYGWLFDCVFVVSCFSSVALFLIDFYRKLSVLQNHNKIETPTPSSSIASFFSATHSHTLV